MRSCFSVLAFVLIGGQSACVSQNGQLYDDAQICGYIQNLGMTTDPTGYYCWADPSGRTVYVLCRKDPAAGQGYWNMVLLSADRVEPVVVDIDGVDLQRQWVDTRGHVWNLPSFGVGAEIDRPSGLFIVCNPADPALSFAVGRVDQPDGWLFRANLPDTLEHGVRVGARGEDVVISEHWSFKVSGIPSPRPHVWVYSPDPDNRGEYKLTARYSHDPWQFLPAGKTPLELDGDWLTPRLAARAD